MPTPNQQFASPCPGFLIGGNTGGVSAFCAVMDYDHPTGQPIGALIGASPGITSNAAGNFPVPGPVWVLPYDPSGNFYPYAHRLELIDASGNVKDWIYVYVQ